MPHMLKNVLSDILTTDELSKLYSAFDVIGTIIIIKIPNSLIQKKEIIAKRLLCNVKAAKSVFAQTSAVMGDYRTRQLEFLAGHNCTITEYKESGCRFKVDVDKTFFSPRLTTERMRIAKAVSENETITNMFAGVGTFSIVIAKTNKTSKVYDIDTNPVAHQLSTFNVKLNKLEGRVFPILGDARNVIAEQLQGQSDRVLMPLPEQAKKYINSAVLALRPNGGLIHYFAHVNARTKKLAVKQGIDDANEAFLNYGHTVLATVVVREVGPRLYQTVSDVFVER
jgi:tRNA (guanine37-N1)-methyltransferase